MQAFQVAPNPSHMVILEDSPKEEAPPEVKKPMLSLNVVPEIDQSWTIERIAQERIPTGWAVPFKDAAPELHDISEILEADEEQHGMFFPLKKDIFRAFEYTQPNQVKVVILGQDPYHQRNSNSNRPRAQGMSFSVARDDSVPSSLKNIYRELKNEYPEFIIPTHGDLTEWATQGVFLLNTGLTVRQGVPGSHGDIWLGFITKMLTYLAKVNQNIIYVLWGAQAQKIQRYLPDSAIVLTSAHPSGLSANRGFIGNGHFRKINELLVKQGRMPINWQITD